MKTNSRGRKGKIGSEKIKREDGFLYFIDSNGYVARTKMNRGGRAKSKKAKKSSARKSSAKRRR